MQKDSQCRTHGQEQGVNKGEDMGGAEENKSTLVRGARDPVAGHGRKRVDRFVGTSWCRTLNFFSPRA